MTRDPHAERQRQRRPVRVARRQAVQHRALENPRALVRRRAGPSGCRPARRSAAARRRRSPRRAPRTPLSRSCVSIRSSRYGRSPTSSRNSTQPSGGSNAYGVPSDAVELRQRAADQHAASPRRAAASRAAGARSRRSARPAQAPHERVAVVAGRTAREPPLEHRAVERDDAARPASARSGSRCCRCSR